MSSAACAAALRPPVSLFVAEGVGQSPWQALRAQLYLGSETFVRGLGGQDAPLAEVPRRQQEPQPASLGELFAAHGEQAIAVAHREHGYRLREIAEHLGCHYATVSRRLRRLEERETPT